MGDPEETTQQHDAPGAGAQSSHAVFLSYASQDAEAARRICEALRAAGIEVWFDQSELRGGDVWDQKIRRQIRDCALFIPVISANTASRHEGYFRLEWDLADERTHRMARDRAFIVPVSVDATPSAGTDMPESFHRVQWTRLLGGETPPAFVERVRRLSLPGPGTPVVSAPATTAAAPAATRRTSPFWLLRAALVAMVVLAVVALGYVTLQRLARAKPAMQAATANSIAVLPLANESGDASQQYFSDGLSEDLITALSQLPGLKVIGRHSSFQFRDSNDDSKTIGAKLGAAHLLEGSVRRAGDVVRVSTELIDTSDGSTKWSERYDRPYKDLFALQDDITRAVAGALRTRLVLGANATQQSDRPPSGNLEAYNAVLEGRFYYGRDTQADVRKAIERFTFATKLDPRYAFAWSYVSRGWGGLASNNDFDLAATPAAFAKARAAADTALTLAPDLASAHIARGWVLNYADFDWRGAEAEYRRALELAPGDSDAKTDLGGQLATLGQVEEAIELTRQALATDPLRATRYLDLAYYYSALGRLDDAERALRRAMELQPNAEQYYAELSVIEIQRGNPQAALAAAQREPPGLYRDAAVAAALQIGKDGAAADAALKDSVDKYATVVPYTIAGLYALRGEADKTFEWLDRAWTNRDPGVTTLLFDPFILRYKNDPRFAAFSRKVGLPVPGESAGT
jgi:TolB-like protein/Flp pilus assembly protein TadD